MRAAIPARRTALPVTADKFHENTGPAQSFLAPLLRLAETSDSLIAGSVGEFSIRGTRFHIPRLIFMGPRGGGDTVRFEIPPRHPRETQIATAVNALRPILDSYRFVLAIQQDL